MENNAGHFLGTVFAIVQILTSVIGFAVIIFRLGTFHQSHLDLKKNFEDHRAEDNAAFAEVRKFIIGTYKAS